MISPKWFIWEMSGTPTKEGDIKTMTKLDDFDRKWNYIKERFPKEHQTVLDFENGANNFLEKLYELSKENDELRQLNLDLYKVLLENNIVYDVGSTNITLKNEL